MSYYIKNYAKFEFKNIAKENYYEVKILVNLMILNCKE